MAFHDIQWTISKEAADFFIENNLLSDVTGNKRKLSTSTLSFTPSIESRPSSALSGNQVSSSSFQATYVREEADSVEIPAILDSRETLEYLGFNSRTSQEI